MTLMNKLYCSKADQNQASIFEFYKPNKKPGNPGSFICIIQYMNSSVKAAFYFKFV